MLLFHAKAGPLVTPWQGWSPPGTLIHDSAGEFCGEATESVAE